VATDASLTANTSIMNWPGLVQSQGSMVPVCQVGPSVPGLTVPPSTLSLSSVSQGMVPATLVVPSSGHVTPTTAVSGQTPMLGVNSTVSNAASVSSVANVITFAAQAAQDLSLGPDRNLTAVHGGRRDPALSERENVRKDKVKW